MPQIPPNSVPISLEGASAFRTKNYITKLQKNIFDFYRNYLYLNGYPPENKEISKFFSIDISSLKQHYCELMSAGLFEYDPERDKVPKLKEFMAGMSRMPFKGEITKTGVNKTRESLVNFFDLINTSDFFTYRIMMDLKFPYYKVGDYVIICKAQKYSDNVNLLCLVEDKPLIGRYTNRTHDCIVTDFATGKTFNTNELHVIGEIIGSIRMETPMEKLFLKGRIKVIGEHEDITKILEE